MSRRAANHRRPAACTPTAWCGHRDEASTVGSAGGRGRDVGGGDGGRPVEARASAARAAGGAPGAPGRRGGKPTPPPFAAHAPRLAVRARAHAAQSGAQTPRSWLPPPLLAPPWHNPARQRHCRARRWRRFRDVGGGLPTHTSPPHPPPTAAWRSRRDTPASLVRVSHCPGRWRRPPHPLTPEHAEMRVASGALWSLPHRHKATSTANGLRVAAQSGRSSGGSGQRRASVPRTGWRARGGGGICENS